MSPYLFKRPGDVAVGAVGTVNTTVFLVVLDNASVGGARGVINGAFIDLTDEFPAASTDCIMKFEYIAPVCRFVIVAVQVVPVCVNEVTLAAPPATAADAAES